jgi:hypothetical protein
VFTAAAAIAAMAAGALAALIEPRR